MCDVGWEPIGAIVRRLVEGLEIGRGSLPAVTPTAALGEGISAPSDTTVCYSRSLWSAFTVACPRAQRSRQDTRPSVATGLPDHSKGALREAALKGLVTPDRGRKGGVEPGATIAAQAGEDSRAQHDALGEGAVIELEKWRDRSRAKVSRDYAQGGQKTVTADAVTRQSVPLALRR